jgi:hypothetical protein
MANKVWFNDGAIVVDGDGKVILCEDCPCGIACNACSPPLPGTLYVTLAGLAGDFAQWNGKHKLTHFGACQWVYPHYDPPSIWIQLLWFTARWLVQITAGGVFPIVCDKRWDGSEDACVQIGNYTEGDCNDAGCPDINSCENSAGATCVVSLT